MIELAFTIAAAIILVPLVLLSIPYILGGVLLVGVSYSAYRLFDIVGLANEMGIFVILFGVCLLLICYVRRNICRWLHRAAAIAHANGDWTKEDVRHGKEYKANWQATKGFRNKVALTLLYTKLSKLRRAQRKAS